MTKKQVNAKELSDFISAVQHAHDAMLSLCLKWEEYDGWDETLCDGYPFGKDLENQVWEVSSWMDNLREHHQRLLAEEQK